MKELYVIFLSGVLVFSACKPEDTCMMAPSPPDLTTEFEPLNGTSIFAGEPFEFISTTWNHADPNNCAGTEAAMDVILQIIVEYKEDQFSPYDTITMEDKPLGTIEGGESIEKNLSLIFSQPGQYRITTLVDAENFISERDEMNNRSSMEQIATQ